MNKLYKGGFGLSLALCATLAVAADNPDAAFFKKAAEGGIAEVALGKLAQEKSSNPNVKDFGAMMVRDHGAANAKLKSIAGSKSIKLPSSSSVTQTGTKAKLEGLGGDTFDKSYIKGSIKDHQDAVKLFQEEVANGQDSEGIAFATATLPTLQEHLKKIQSIASAQSIKTD
jgi:putative membrane protein